MTKFPYCCAAPQTAQDCDMVIIEYGEISWYNGAEEVVTVKVCPFCGYVEDSTVTLPENTQ